jgi:TolA-binding protein
VQSLIESQDFEEAEEAFDKLVADFDGHPNLEDTLYAIARQYGEAGVYEDERGVYQLIIQKYPDSQYMNVAEIGVSKTELSSFIAAEDYNKVDAAIKQMIVDHLNNDRIGDALYEIAYNYYYSQGKYEKAAEFFQRVVTDWPDNKYAWNAQCWVGICYENLRDTSGMPEAEATAKMEQAYQRVIDNYPDCSLVGYACLKLANLNISRKQMVEAAAYLEKFLENSSDDPRVSSVLYDLGQIYEQMGELDSAKEVYTEFIKADPNSPLVKTIKAKLEEMEGASK